jgi:predicted outer membrane protein
MAEADQAQSAVNKAQTAAVRAFAQTMVDQHSAAVTRVTALAGTAHVMPTSSALSDQLRQNVSATTVSSARRTHVVRYTVSAEQSQVVLYQCILSSLDTRCASRAE